MNYIYKILMILLVSMNMAHLSYANSFGKKEKTITVADNQVTRLNCIVANSNSGSVSMQWIRSFIPQNYLIQLTSKFGIAGKNEVQSVKYFKDKISFNYIIKNNGDLDSLIKHTYFKRTKKLGISFYIPEKHYLFGDGPFLHDKRLDAVIWGDCKEEVLIASRQGTKKFDVASNDKLFKGLFNNVDICDKASTSEGTWNNHPDLLEFVEEAKFRGLDCGVKDSKNTVIASKPIIQTYTKPVALSAELDAANERARELEQELEQLALSAELDAANERARKLEQELVKLREKQQEQQHRMDSDNQEPIINAFSKQNGPNAIISGRVSDNIEIAEVLVDGQVITIKNNGTFETKFYVPRSGKTIEIVAFDTKGNKASKLFKIERGNIQQANVQKFKSLNPSLKTVKSNPSALALIIGISNYENTKASALYADSDAKMFYDYANLKLGIPSSNIKELVNDSAERIDITRAIKSWLLKRTVTDKTDIYVFFAGHGLATDDGKDVYLLPYDGVPDLLEDSSIKRKELFADIQATKPRSVTVFLDTCYSGGTRNEETLVASLRPIIITAKEQAIPSNFTVLSAAQGNQTSQSLEEVKHGLFSYYTMLGMEGGADSNNDNKITARELHAFIKDKVERQSQFRQTPELQGDKDRVLVQFN